MLEYYAAYWNYEDNMRFTEAMLSHVIEKLFGSLKIRILSREGGSVEVDFTPPWPRHEFAKLIEDACGIDIFAHNESADSLRAAIKKAKVEIEDLAKLGYGNMCDALYKKVARPNLIQPCFVIHHPASTKPLARRKDDAPHLCETFQLLVNTWEVVNAYSELVDPIDQRQRFIDQMKAQLQGDDEAMETDEDYLRAMEHGMPPISGWGMGVDRILALLTEQSNLKDVVLFPLLRPLESDLKAESKMREKAKKAMKKK
jgi:lysyl-tRNA synthetase class 2